MEFVNLLSARQRSDTWQTATYHQCLEVLLVLLAPVAPFIADELWSLTGHHGSVHQQPWPSWDNRLAMDDRVEIAVQVNGRVREIISLPLDASQDEALNLAQAQSKVASYLEGHSIQKIVYIPGKILNIVVA